MEALLAVSPYVNGPFDSRAKDFAEAAFSDLNQLANEPNMAYLKRKLGEWCREAPRPACKQTAVDADQPAPAARRSHPRRHWQSRQTLPLVETTAVGLYLISKAFRPEFEARGAPERAPDRDSLAAQCPGCIAPYLEAERHRKALIMP